MNHRRSAYLMKGDKKHLKTHFPNESETYLDEILQMIEIVGMKLRNRSNKAQRSLFEFIRKTDYYDVLQKDVDSNGYLTIESLFYFASQFMEIREYSPREVIYYQGEIAENVYLLLLGDMEFKAFEYQTRPYTFEEYCQYLSSIKNDPYLAQFTINYNEPVYSIMNRSDITLLPLIKTKREILKYATVNDIQEIASVYQNKKLEDSFLRFDEVLASTMSMDEYYENLLQSFTEKETYYSNLLSPTRKDVTTISYSPSWFSDKKMASFGNFRLGDTNHKLTETSSAKSTVIILAINKKQYSNCVANDQKLFIEKEITYLHESYFFKRMRRGMFVQYLFREFKYKEYSWNNILYREGERVDTLYIIQEGSVELTVNNKSLIELKSIITKLKAADTREFAKEEFDDTVHLLNPFSYLTESLQEKKTFVLFETSRTSLAEWEFYYNMPAIYTARISSKHAKIYALPLDRLLNKENKDLAALKSELKEASLTQLSRSLKRLIQIKRSQFEKIDSDLNSDIQEVERMDKMNNSMKSNCSPLKNSSTVVNTSPGHRSLFSNHKYNRIEHHKTNSLHSDPNTIRKVRKLKVKEESLVFIDKKLLFAAFGNRNVILTTKQRIKKIEMKRKLKRMEENTNTSAAVPLTLPSLSLETSTGKNMKNSLEYIKLIPKYSHDNNGLITLKLSNDSLPATNLNLNYLAMQKYKEDSKKCMREAFKLKYSGKKKNLIKNNNNKS